MQAICVDQGKISKQNEIHHFFCYWQQCLLNCQDKIEHENAYGSSVCLFVCVFVRLSLPYMTSAAEEHLLVVHM